MRIPSARVRLTTPWPLVALCLGCGTASAQTTANFNVTATVLENCSIASTNHAFGNYDPLVANASAPLDATSTITLTCTQGTTSVIELSPGNNAGPTRSMSNGIALLGYELFRDTARTLVWGTGANSLDPGAAPSTAPRTFTVYGRVPPGQAIPTGAYTDVVTATVVL